MTCPTTEQLQRYYDNELRESERTAVEHHVAGCRPCTDYLSQLNDLSSWFVQVDLPVLTAAEQQRMQQAWFAAREGGVRSIAAWSSAIAAALIAGLMLFTPAGTTSQASAASTAGPTYVETIAMMPPVDTHDNGDPQVVQVAQWMASDLSQ